MQDYVCFPNVSLPAEFFTGNCTRMWESTSTVAVLALVLKFAGVLSSYVEKFIGPQSSNRLRRQWPQ